MQDNQQLTARQVWERQHECVRNFDADGQAELFAEDGVWELPFAPDPLPRRLAGREQIRAFGKNGMERSRQIGRKILGYEDVVVHETTNPEVIVAEFTLRGSTADGQEYRTPYVQVVRVHGNRIVSLTDYLALNLPSSDA